MNYYSRPLKFPDEKLSLDMQRQDEVSIFLKVYSHKIEKLTLEETLRMFHRWIERGHYGI